jgi:hypothetical protein
MQFYSSKLQLAHAFLRVNIKDQQYLSEAVTIFEHSLKGLLQKTKSGKVLQVKTYVDNRGEEGAAQIRCYFSYQPGNAEMPQTQEEWVKFLAENLGEHIEGKPAFIQMSPPL